MRTTFIPLPSIYTVKWTDDGRHQPTRNGVPHFEAFDTYIEAHCACKVAEQRAHGRFARLQLRAKSEA